MGWWAPKDSAVCAQPDMAEDAMPRVWANDAMGTWGAQAMNKRSKCGECGNPVLLDAIDGRPCWHVPSSNGCSVLRGMYRPDGHGGVEKISAQSVRAGQRGAQLGGGDGSWSWQEKEDRAYERSAQPITGSAPQKPSITVSLEQLQKLAYGIMGKAQQVANHLLGASDLENAQQDSADPKSVTAILQSILHACEEAYRHLDRIQTGL